VIRRRSIALVLLFTAASYAQYQPRRIATLEDSRITESSGIVASRKNPGIYWTHNDSGDEPLLYAFDRTGRSRGTWRIPQATNIDWEDIAIGPSPQRGRWYLYAGDIGDNDRNRRDIVIYRVEEPRLANCPKPCLTAPPAIFRLRYPDGPHNAETLLVHPSTGDLYVISKAGPGDTNTTVYVARAARLAQAPVTLERLATLDIPELLFRSVVGGLTGGDISPDGRRLILCDYFRIYEAALPKGATFDDIWHQHFTSTTIGVGLQVEGVCFRADQKAVLITSEGSPCPLIEVLLTGPH
jgi:hypothetical protein